LLDHVVVAHGGFESVVLPNGSTPGEP
jgi:hypothetical protein